MSVSHEGDRIRLFDESKVEDAEALVTFLRAGDAPAVDLSETARLHTAVIQVLLAFRPSIKGPTADALVAKILAAPETMTRPDSVK